MSRYATLRGQALAGALLWFSLLLAAWLYWPGLQGAAMLDDGANLQGIHALDEDPRYLADVVVRNNSGPFGRPVTMLSFGLEQVYAPAGTYGFKRSNLMLHLLGACLVAWLGARLLPLFVEGAGAATGAMVGIPWVLTPVAVSTTLYIVQRMAQLPAIFCLLGLLCYLIGRQRLEREARWGWLLCAAVFPCCVLAFLSKENGIVLLPLVVLLEATVWKWRVASRTGATLVLRAIHAATVCCALLAVAAYLAFSGVEVLHAYAGRDFTLTERLMTQSRTLLEYLFRLLVPLREGLGVYHDDYPVSRGLLQPWTTLPCLVLLLAGIAFALVRSFRGRCVLGFGLLFFLVAHSVESGFLPLELYFEHRNYLPSFGVYLAAVALIARTVRRHRWVRWPSCMLVAGWLVWAAISTGLQSAIWSNEAVQLLDAERAHPRSPRVKANLAALHARMQEIPAMLGYAAAAAALDHEPGHARHIVNRLALFCIADQPLPDGFTAELRASIDQQALADRRFNENMQVFVTRMNRGRCPRLDATAVATVFREVLHARPDTAAPPGLYAVLAMLEIYIEPSAVALEYTERWLARDPRSVTAWMMKLHIATALGNEGARDEAFAALQALEREGLVGEEQRDDIGLYR